MNYQQIKQKLLDNDFQICGKIIVKDLSGEIPDIINVYCDHTNFKEQCNLLKQIFNINDSLEIFPYSYSTEALVNEFNNYVKFNKNIIEFMRNNNNCISDDLLKSLNILNENYMKYLIEKNKIGMRFEVETEIGETSNLMVDLITDQTYFEDLDIHNLYYDKNGNIHSFKFSEEETKKIIENISNKKAQFFNHFNKQQYVTLLNEGWYIGENKKTSEDAKDAKGEI